MDNFFASKRSIKKQHMNSTNGVDPILDLGNAIHNKLQVKDEDSETSSQSPSDEDGSSGLDSIEDENTSDHDLHLENANVMASKSVHECVAFHVSASSDGIEPKSHAEDCKVCSPSLSTPARKLVSAIKGSREKEGIPKQKLSVSWAPDVYDPPPSSVSHYPKKKSHQQYSRSYKKHGKGKQKGKSVRGGSSPKEKKHYRKTGGSSSRSVHSYADTDRLDKYNSSMELLDYNDPGIGSPDPNCGSKFLGQASGTTHCVY